MVEANSVERGSCTQCHLMRRQMTEREGFKYVISKRNLLGCRECAYVKDAEFFIDQWKKTYKMKNKT